MAGFSTAISSLGKAAADATTAIKDKVTHANMLAEFNKEQDTFIKSKGERRLVGSQIPARSQKSKEKIHLNPELGIFETLVLVLSFELVIEI